MLSCIMPICAYLVLRQLASTAESEPVVITNIFHSLSGNGIGDQGGIAIGTALKECRLLEELQYVLKVCMQTS